MPVDEILCTSRVACSGLPPLPVCWRQRATYETPTQPEKNPSKKRKSLTRPEEADAATAVAVAAQVQGQEQLISHPRLKKRKEHQALTSKKPAAAAAAAAAPACASFYTYCASKGAYIGTVVFQIVDESPAGALEANQHAGIIESSSTLSDNKSFLLLPYCDALSDPINFSLDDAENSGTQKACKGLEFLFVELVPTRKKAITPIDNEKYDLLIFEVALPTAIFQNGIAGLPAAASRFLVCNRAALRTHIYKMLPTDLNGGKLAVRSIREAVYRFYRKGRQNKMSTLVPTVDVIAEGIGYYI